MFSRLFALRLFEAFSIQRWNDRIRPVPLTEMDKQGFKAVLTYLFAKVEEARGVSINWDYLMHATVFALLKNIALSDIKAPVIRQIKLTNPDAFKELNDWVVDQFEPVIDDAEFMTRFRTFLHSRDDDDDVNFHIIRAAHKYSTFREFQIVEQANKTAYGLEEVKKSLLNDLNAFTDLDGFKEVHGQQSMYDAVCLIEQLRFQTRWSQTPRIPTTSVLGHSMLVATFMFFLSRQVDAGPSRTYNNFFAGLFHDLPEAVVRDIVSPVKRATHALPDIVRRIEREVCDTELFPKLPDHISDELRYFAGFDVEGKSEFADRVKENGRPRALSEAESLRDFEDQSNSPLDGQLLKMADEVAAFLEAYSSIRHGITSRHLEDGMARIRQKYLDVGEVSGVEVRSFFLSFD